MNTGDTTITYTGKPRERSDQPCEGGHHVVIDTNRAGGLACLHCGAFYPMAYPVPMSLSIVILREWGRLHKRCTFKPGLGDCPYDHSKRALAYVKRMRPVPRAIPDRALTRLQKRRLWAQSIMRIPGRQAVAEFTYWLAHGLRWFASRGRG